MTARAKTVLDALKKRPLRERRILAATTYLTAAAVVVALWAASLERTLSPGELAPAGGAPPAAAGAEGTPLAAKPASPLDALGEAIAGIFSQSKNLMAELNRAESREPPLATSTNSISTAGTLRETPVANPAAEAAGQPERAARAKVAPQDPAALIASTDASSADSARASAELLALPLPTLAMPQRRIGDIIRYNLGELRRTAVDVFRYLTQ